MNELPPWLGAITQTMPYLCAAIAATLVGAAILATRRSHRAPKRQAPRRKVGFEERMRELGLVEVDDPMDDPPVVLEVSTVVPTGMLQVGIGDAEQTAVRGSRHIGDAEFDPWFEVEGELEDLALLSADVRRILRNVARNTRPRIASGWLTLSGPGNLDVDSRIAPMVAVASAIEAAAVGDPVSRIRRFAQDPDPGVRMRCLEVLSNRPPSPVASAVARDHLDDPDPIVRTLAAVLARDSSRLVSIAQSEDTPPGVRRRAARALLHTGSKEEQFAAATALASGPTPLHSVAYELCEPLGGVAEPVLIELVGSPNLDVAKGAAGRLAKIGTIRAIPALREFQERTGQLEGPLRPELARAIQSLRSTPSLPKRTDEPTRPLPAAS
ncbi:MAG: hypothetical protein ABMB14_37460, partial [Myxococcota bacterium]